MAPKITPTMKNPLSLWNMCKHWPLYTLSIAPLKIIFLNFFLPVFFFKPSSFHPYPKRNQIRLVSTPGNFCNNTYIFRMELLAWSMSTG